MKKKKKKLKQQKQQKEEEEDEKEALALFLQKFAKIRNILCFYGINVSLKSYSKKRFKFNNVEMNKK